MIQSKARQQQQDRHNHQTHDSQESTRVFQVILTNSSLRALFNLLEILAIEIPNL